MSELKPKTVVLSPLAAEKLAPVEAVHPKKLYPDEIFAKTVIDWPGDTIPLGDCPSERPADPPVVETTEYCITGGGGGCLVGVTVGVGVLVGVIVGLGVLGGLETGIKDGVGVGVGVETGTTSLHPKFLLSLYFFIYSFPLSEELCDPINPNTFFSGFP
jgi:hypothetical protein